MIDISTTEFEADLNSDWIKLVTELRNKEEGVSYEERSYSDPQRLESSTIKKSIDEFMESLVALLGIKIDPP